MNSLTNGEETNRSNEVFVWDDWCNAEYFVDQDQLGETNNINTTGGINSLQDLCWLDEIIDMLDSITAHEPSLTDKLHQTFLLDQLTKAQSAQESFDTDKAGYFKEAVAANLEDSLAPKKDSGDEHK